MPKPEFFRHYKGGIYEWVAMAHHTETGEVFAVYKCEYGEIWARPLNMFNGVTESGIRRFTKIENEAAGNG